jgi:hypothetical protein
LRVGPPAHVSKPDLEKLVVDLKDQAVAMVRELQKSREGGVVRSLVLRLSVAADPQRR